MWPSVGFVETEYPWVGEGHILTASLPILSVNGQIITWLSTVINRLEEI